MTIGDLILRLLAMVPVLFVAALVSFAITKIAPGNVAIMILGEHGSDEAVAALERQRGLVRRCNAQFFDWVAGVLQADFGQSLRLSWPVSEVAGTCSGTRPLWAPPRLSG